MRLLSVVAGSSIVLAACAAPAPDTSEPMAETNQSIVGGSASTDAQDSTVLLNEAGTPSCTGTLIAPNLVLTARHCVTDYNPNSECGLPLRGEIGAQLITVSIGIHGSASSWRARGTKFYVAPATSTGLCGADVALVLIDTDLPGPNAKVRFAPPTLNEMTTVVGYGSDGTGRRQRSNVQVLAIGPTSTGYTTAGGQSLTMTLPANDVATGESTCFGDSGGPLFDALGQVMAVGSRGIDEYCQDRPTYWTALSAYEQLIRNAALAAGHPLQEATVPLTRDGKPVTSTDRPKGDPSGDDSSEDSSDKSTARRKPNVDVMSRGCAASGRFAGVSAPWVEVGLALAVAAGTRRRRRRGEG